MGGHVLITGGGTGIGRSVAQALAANYAVSLVGRRKGPLQEVASQLREAAGFEADVTDEGRLAAAVRSATERFGPIDVLVAAAGISRTSPAGKTDTQMLRDMFAVNVEGVLNAVKLVLPAMLEARNGRIVAIASTAALKGYAYAGAYAATKHAVLGLIRSLALETATKGVTANAVCPGFADTEMTATSVARIVEKTGRSEAEALAALCANSPMKRLIAPEEVADTVRWLVGPQAGAVTGQAIAVAGGEVM